MTMEELGREYLATADKLKGRIAQLKGTMSRYGKGQQERIWGRIHALEEMEADARTTGIRLCQYYQRQEGGGAPP